MRLHLYGMSRVGKSIKTESRLLVTRGWVEQGEETPDRYRVYFEMMQVFWNLSNGDSSMK